MFFNERFCMEFSGVQGQRKYVKKIAYVKIKKTGYLQGLKYAEA